MARNIWNGSISARMLSIPVTLASAVSEGGLELHQYAPDGGRVKYRRVSEASGQEVPYGEIRMGYAAPDGTVAYLTDDDFAEAYGEVSRNAQILMFTDPARVPDMARCRPFIIAPAKEKGRKAKEWDRGSERAYALLAAALKSTGKVAIVVFGLRQRKRLAVISEQDGYLVLEQLEWHEDLAAPDFAAPSVALSNAELTAAGDLVADMSADFCHSDYADDSRARVEAMIEARLAPAPAVAEAAAVAADEGVTAFGDLLASINASLASGRTAKASA
jgi:DNA end-binding protein Ku